MNRVTLILQWLLPFLAVAVAITAFLANFRGTITQFLAGDPATITLTLITLLCGTYGVERWVNAAQIDKRLFGIEEILSKSPSVLLVHNSYDVYRAATKLASTTEGQLRAVVVSPGPKAPSDYAETIARRFKEKHDAGHPISFNAVLILDSGKMGNLDEFERAMDERLHIYRVHGVLEYVHPYILDTSRPMTFDVLIVDRNHIHIGFTSNKYGKVLDNGIELENQPQIASSLADWFDGTVLPMAKPLEDWIKDQRKKRRKAQPSKAD